MDALSRRRQDQLANRHSDTTINALPSRESLQAVRKWQLKSSLKPLEDDKKEVLVRSATTTPSKRLFPVEGGFESLGDEAPAKALGSKEGLEVEHGILVADVIDTGIGMEEQELQRLFQPFVQANGSIQQTFGGTGLGLWICKEIVEHMAGEITVYSKPGVGTRIRFTLPFDAYPTHDPDHDRPRHQVQTPTERHNQDQDQDQDQGRDQDQDQDQDQHPDPGQDKFQDKSRGQGLGLGLGLGLGQGRAPLHARSMAQTTAWGNQEVAMRVKELRRKKRVSLHTSAHVRRPARRLRLLLLEDEGSAKDEKMGQVLEALGSVACEVFYSSYDEVVTSLQELHFEVHALLLIAGDWPNNVKLCLRRATDVCAPHAAKGVPTFLLVGEFAAY